MAVLPHSILCCPFLCIPIHPANTGLLPNMSLGSSPPGSLLWSLVFAGAALLAGYATGRYLGLDEVTSSTYLVSSALCIAAIACLSKQESARTGNALGLLGVSGGVFATLGNLNVDPGTYAQVSERCGSCQAGGGGGAEGLHAQCGP